MARGAHGVTCLECGCLNFSSAHEKCDKCLFKTLTFRHSARWLASSCGDGSSQRSFYAATPVASPGKKRRYDEMKKAPRTDGAEMRTREMPALVPSARRTPDVIDLISDDEVEDVTGSQVATTERLDDKEVEVDDKETGQLFRSRTFPTVAYVESDFPSLEEATQMRKIVVERTLLHSKVVECTNGRTEGHEKAWQSDVQSSVAVLRPANGMVEQNSIESRPVGMGSEANKAKAKVKIPTMATAMAVNGHGKVGGTVTTEQRKEDLTTIGANPIARDKEANRVEDSKAELLCQSRVFDAIEFQDSDFGTVFDGLALARRSHPKSPLSNTPTSRYVGQVSYATVRSEIAEAEGSTERIKSALAQPSTPLRIAAKEKPASATTENSSSKTLTQRTATATNTLTSARSTNVLEPVSKAAAAPSVQYLSTKLSSEPAAITDKPLPLKTPDTQSTLDTAALVPKPFQTPLTPSEVTILLKIASLPTQASLIPNTTKSITTYRKIVPAPSKLARAMSVSTPKAPFSSVRPKSVSTAKATNTAIRPKAVSSIPASVNNPAARKKSSASHTSANVIGLLDKKNRKGGVQQRGVVEKRQTVASLMDVKTSATGDNLELVKVHAEAREMLPVEPPVLGYCCPEFLTFMRECGDEDGEEEEDPEEVSRSQLRLLDVVDLTHLSDSEDSDALSTPRPVIKPSNLSTGTQAVGLMLNGNASGSGPLCVPTLESERKRTQLEKAVCELCEEKGALYRLIRCPTCTKYYHKKCAKENGDENVCWNCELGSLIDDSELDEEHAKHTSEYLTYLKALRSSSWPEGTEVENNDVEEREEEDADDNEESGLEEGECPEFAEVNNAKPAGKIWMEFLGGVTADIDASYQEVTNRIAEELRDDKKKGLYTRGFVSREEFEAQMTEVENFYISEEARLQQLEREKALEAKKRAEARKVQAEADLANGGEQAAVSSGITSNALSVPTAGDQDGANSDNVSLHGVTEADNSTSTVTDSVPVISQPVDPIVSPATVPALSTASVSVPTKARLAPLTISSSRVASSTISPP